MSFAHTLQDRAKNHNTSIKMTCRVSFIYGSFLKFRWFCVTAVLKNVSDSRLENCDLPRKTTLRVLLRALHHICGDGKLADAIFHRKTTPARPSTFNNRYLRNPVGESICPLGHHVDFAAETSFYSLVCTTIFYVPVQY